MTIGRLALVVYLIVAFGAGLSAASRHDNNDIYIFGGLLWPLAVGIIIDRAAVVATPVTEPVEG